MAIRQIALVNGNVFTGEHFLKDHALLLLGDKVNGIVPRHDIPEQYEMRDMDGAYVSPGLIDLQIYGTGGDLFSADLRETTLHRIESNLLAQGCTSFMLTLATNTIELFKKSIAVFLRAKPEVALGLHLEGPFLNPLKRGAHPQELIIEGTLQRIKDLLMDSHDAVRMMTIAPELMNKDSIAYLLEQGIVLSAGHSAATFEQATLGFNLGIQTTTHLWNAMSAFHHRDTGLPGAVSAHPTAFASIIVDGIHVDYQGVKLSKKLLGDRLFLITDAVAKCESGIYKHILKGDHFVLPDGTLSGSALTLLGAVANCVQHAGISLEEALRMATAYPAKIIDRTDIGNFNQGSIANVVVFDNSFQVKSVYFKGKLIC